MAYRSKTKKQESGKLYLVATPIGNLEDITYRAVKILQKVDIIAAEDTRKSGILLDKYDINTPMLSYHKFNEKERAGVLTDRIKAGEDIAVISDAGTPGISDPAREIVKKSVELGIKIIPIPGPSAAISALAASGLESTTFSFYGFLPKTENKIIKFLENVKFREETSVFYESPRRVCETLKIIKQVMNNREVVVAKELTKIYEHFFRGTVEAVLEMLNEENLKGEFVIMISGAENSKQVDDITIKELLEEMLQQGMTKKSAVEQIVERYDIRKNRVYKISLEI
ncbi:MAG: 16S rRNA (cytidine(1402)-2'-O)-methyltransferase [Candidatus Cloacimonetes bacterium]|nr:16S rRNA (cytidine(1402)-2'-O)-methyltransferase [Candidatus Cloacimonadota bacterium]MBS3767390.1 16S rRNA (cytidine(1402)-2'-O)-methyltransferase [Candidatus Cloacimonadota bacterium]